MIQLSPEADAMFQKCIHRDYGHLSGLLPHEYHVIIDERGDYEVEVKAGKKILIAVTYAPLHPKFKPVMTEVFSQWPLREFLPANPAKPDGGKYQELSMSGITTPIAKKNLMSQVVTEYVTMLKMTDRKTKRSVMVQMTGNVFDVQDEALRMLFGERLL